VRVLSGADLLICPICGAALRLGGGAFACVRGHTFDRAREGYVNLLRSRRTGDSKQMLLARRAFLDRGYFAPPARTLCAIVREHLGERGQDDGPAAILDAGCGEGYYLAQLMSALDEARSRERPCYVGLDSSKDAIRLASKRCRGAFFLVADIQESIPLADRSLQVLINIFAPRHIGEFARVLAPGGLLLIVIPAPTHLIELREQLGLLSIEEQKLERIVASLHAEFEGIATQHLAYSMRMRAEDLLLLIEMTPNSRHAARWSHAALVEMEGVPISAAFVLVTARRRC
jgi:23S rRNA (guanine745-N1)-methyltransferase